MTLQKEKDHQNLLQSLIRKHGGDPSQAIPVLIDRDSFWACPTKNPKEVLVISIHHPNPQPKILSISKFPTTPIFPNPTPDPDPNWDIALAFCQIPSAAHNAIATLAWLKASIAKRQGLLFPAQRREEETNSLRLEQSIRKMLQINTAQKMLAHRE